MPNATLEDQRPQKGLKLLHSLSESNALLGREAKCMERKTHLGHRDAPLLKVAGKPRKKRPKRTHQKENGAKNGNAFHP